MSVLMGAGRGVEIWKIKQEDLRGTILEGGCAMEIEPGLKERKEENLLITFKMSQNLLLVSGDSWDGGNVSDG